MTAKKNKIKMVLTRLVSYLPTNSFRLMGYRLFSYSFGPGCKLDWGFGFVWIALLQVIIFPFDAEPGY
jgi:hypothetical protein